MKLFKLGQVCKLVGGGTPSKSNLGFYNGDIPWATVRDLRSRWLKDTEHKINLSAVEQSSTNVIPAGNVVLASRVGLGKVVQLKRDTAINQDLRALVPRENSKIDSNYLYYWTLSISPQIISAGRGATVQGVTLPFLENLEIPVPSLEKQREIVKKLDFVFTDMDTLIKEAELNRNLLRQIYEQEIENIFYRNTNGWPSTTIEESCDFKNGKAHEQLVDPAGNYRLVTSKFVSSNGKLARRVTQALTPLVSGDVAFVLSDLPNGKALAKAYLVESEEDLTLNQRVLRVKSSKFIPKFLYLQVNRHPYLLSFDNGESQTHLKLAQALSCPLLIPVLNVQKQTAERLIELRSEVEHSEKVLDQKVLLLSALRQSFLFQAFDHTEPAEAVA